MGLESTASHGILPPWTDPRFKRNHRGRAETTDDRRVPEVHRASAPKGAKRNPWVRRAHRQYPEGQHASFGATLRLMTDAKLAIELRAISGELETILAQEQTASDEMKRRFADDHGAIEKLLQSVQELKSGGRWRNTRFNVLDVLGVPRREGAHSSFLAWVLDPAEAHGFGDAFLREFMRRVIGKEPPSTFDVAVSSEYLCGANRFDIHVKGDHWCLVVENKVDDSPWDDQCHRYQEYCEKLKGRGEEAWLVYVTRPARRPPNRAIPWLSYREVRQILESLPPDPSAAVLIEHFCEHIISDLEA